MKPIYEQKKSQILFLPSTPCNIPVGKNAEKVCKCIFDNMARYFECQINKNALLQTVFLAILPTGTTHSLQLIPGIHVLYGSTIIPNIDTIIQFLINGHSTD